MPSLTYDELKARQRRERDTHPEGLALRVHRALSWLNRAEHETDDGDAQFIFLWIAFNAVYASPSLKEDGYTEQAVFRRFLADVLRLDSHKHLSNLVWHQFSQAIRVLLDNPYVFQPFWDAQSPDALNPDWRSLFETDKRRAHEALARQDTHGVLLTVLKRLYTLRNQLLHGGATWNSQVNRDQVRDGARVMSQLVPILIDILMDHPEYPWGAVMYPVVPETE